MISKTIEINFRAQNILLNGTSNAYCCFYTYCGFPLLIDNKNSTPWALYLNCCHFSTYFDDYLCSQPIVRTDKKHSILSIFDVIGYDYLKDENNVLIEEWPLNKYLSTLKDLKNDFDINNAQKEDSSIYVSPKSYDTVINKKIKFEALDFNLGDNCFARFFVKHFLGNNEDQNFCAYMNVFEIYRDNQLLWMERVFDQCDDDFLNNVLGDKKYFFNNLFLTRPENVIDGKTQLEKRKSFFRLKLEKEIPTSHQEISQNICKI